MTDRPADPAPRLWAQLLGSVQIRVDDQVLDDGRWRPRVARSLLLLLLLAPGQRLPRERVLDGLWPELDPEAARNAYYKALHALRRTLEPDLPPRQTGAFVDADLEAIALRANAGETDVAAFEAALARVGAAAGGQRRERLREALALYRGDLLADEPYHDWASERRDRLHHAWRRAVLELAALDLDAGEPLTSAPALEALLAVDPSAEAAHQALIRAFDAGGQRDRALRQYQRCVDALREDLGVEPSPETRALAARLRLPDSDPGPTPARATGRRQHLPAPASPLVGREREVERVQDLLWRPDVRLVTLTGPGGVGKTRLALEVAALVAPELAEGVCFVGLGPLRDPELVLPATARALGVREGREHSLDSLVREAIGDGEMLLLLDNFEQVAAAAPVVADLLAGCPRLRVLVTSREPLRLRAEHHFPVAPLVAPDRPASGPGQPDRSLSALARNPAVELFGQRATAIDPAFALTAANAEDVAALCLRLDGLPLAIELAAARTRERTVAELLAGLRDRFEVLRDGYRDLPPRQQTMRDAIGWSYALLSAAEQALFRRLAVFSGGGDLEAVAVVGRRTEDGGRKDDGADPSVRHPEGTRPPPSVLDLVASLVDKSLLRLADPDRIEMLETLRDYGAEQLAASGEAESARRAHADYFLALIETADAHLRGPDTAPWLGRLDRELDNLRAALTWAIEGGDATRALRLAGGLWRVGWIRGFMSECRQWLERALAVQGPASPRDRGLALNGAATLAEVQGDYPLATILHERAIALWREVGDRAGVSRALSGLATVAAHQGDYARAESLNGQALKLARAAGDEPGIGRALDRLGGLATRRGDYDAAKARFGESLAIFERLGDRVNASIILNNLGEVCQQHGDLARAIAYFEESLGLSRELDDPEGIAVTLANLGGTYLDAGEIERAVSLTAEALRLFRELDDPLARASALLVLGTATRELGEVGRAAAYLSESLDSYAAADERPAIPELLESLGAVAVALSQPRRAAGLFGAAAALRAAIGVPYTASERARLDRDVAAARGALCESEYAAAVAEGRSWSLERAVAEALGAGAAAQGAFPRDSTVRPVVGPAAAGSGHG